MGSVGGVHGYPFTPLQTDVLLARLVVILDVCAMVLHRVVLCVLCFSLSYWRGDADLRIRQGS